METSKSCKSSSAVKELYTAFVRERRYTKGVSARTEEWYQQGWNAFREVLDGHYDANAFTKETFSPAIERMLQRGVSPITVNTCARAINAFLRWLHEEGKCPRLMVIPRLKEPTMVIRTFRVEEIQRLYEYRPKSMVERRVHVLALLIADTGMRLHEALSLQGSDVDLDNLLITVREAKGGKQRVIPFSTAMRKPLFKYMDRRDDGLIFSTRNGLPMLQNNVRRDFARLCKRIRIGANVKGGFHVLRHGFATEYLRNGGDVFRLQRILGHTTLEMTRRYVNLQTADLSAVHSKLSLLSRTVRG